MFQVGSLAHIRDQLGQQADPRGRSPLRCAAPHRRLAATMPICRARFRPAGVVRLPAGRARAVYSDRNKWLALLLSSAGTKSPHVPG